MPRTARIVVPNLPYHITQRGNYRQDVFEDDEDRLSYLSWIDYYSKKYKLSIFAYCLMDNHVHFIGIPREEDSLARVFSISHMRYSQYFNKKKNASGHLWQGRFYSCVMDEDYLAAALRYVERNPVRAGIVRKPWRWKWSSAGVHVGQEDGVINLENITSLIDTTAEEWKEYINSDENDEKVEKIRKHTLLGRPLGTKDFVAKLGRRIGRVLNVLPRGRPKKQRGNK
ncbi:transposase and inactivated derivatives [Candidatus Scalindua japonica]|uniref:Transposase and inactivated derivatives n=1 Tax=Candidatus Scalindua japonica TaxID=1284222 RepID=A0A286TZV6_9BACT|nr:transposase [Candidatus Scalindua japonica]GAX61341.1 transposase and inactivated derivatives [Candidatus Scalindua japonica]